jgi:flagellin-like hook-associated protein FlgL
VGTENSGVASAPLAGSDVNQQRAGGIFGILADLHTALETGDFRDMGRLDRLLNAEADRFNAVRGDVGSRLAALDRISNRLADENVLLQESLSKEFDTDLTEAITRIAQIQTVLEAVMRIAAQTSQLSLLSFL